MANGSTFYEPSWKPKTPKPTEGPLDGALKLYVYLLKVKFKIF